jgi:hypothetical protein
MIDIPAPSDDPHDGDLRRHTSWWWTQSVSLFNWTIQDPEFSELMRLREKHGIPNTTFPTIEPRHSKQPRAGHIRLPSLSKPGGDVILRCSPYAENDLDKFLLNRRGFVVGMAYVPLPLNCTNKEIRFLQDLFQRKLTRSGLCFTGWQNSIDIPIEGRLMTMAARLAERGAPARLKTRYELERALVMEDWEDVLQDWLVIPDLSCSHPGFSITHACRPQLLNLFRSRARSRARTLLYVHDPIALGTELATFLEHEYVIVPLHDLPAMPQEKVDWSNSNQEG